MRHRAGVWEVAPGIDAMVQRGDCVWAGKAFVGKTERLMLTLHLPGVTAGSC